MSSGELRSYRPGAKLWRTTQDELDRYLETRWNRAA
jgi:hypothetical protein